MLVAWVPVAEADGGGGHDICFVLHLGEWMSIGLPQTFLDLGDAEASSQHPYAAIVFNFTHHQTT